MKDSEVLRELERTVKMEPDRKARWTRIATDIAFLGPFAFRPQFSDRVMRSLAEARRLKEESLYWNLRWMFARVALAGTALALLLAAYSVTGGADLAGTLVESLLGLPSPDFESVIILAGA